MGTKFPKTQGGRKLRGESECFPTGRGTNPSRHYDVHYLERRMDMWKEARISEILHEGKDIKNRIIRKKRSKSASYLQRFIRLNAARGNISCFAMH